MYWNNKGPSSIVSPTQEVKRFKTQQLIVLYWHITLSTAGPVLSKEQYVNFSQQRLLSLRAWLGTCAIKAEYKLHGAIHYSEQSISSIGLWQPFVRLTLTPVHRTIHVEKCILQLESVAPLPKHTKLV